MRKYLVSIALAASMATAFAVDRAAADVDCTPSGSSLGVPNWDTASGCSGNTRIRNTDATCLTASWSESYSAADFGYTYSVTNECSDYGNIVVHADRKDSVDYMRCHGSGEAEGSAVTEIRKITCCFEDEEDLCWKSQVEANSQGQIRQVEWNGDTISGTLVTLATHQQRYDFCQNNPDDVYCKVDPSGDAKTPPPPPSTECDGKPCTIQHCRDEFEDSPAAEGSNSCNTLWLTYPPVPYEFASQGVTPDDDKFPLAENTCSVLFANCARNTSSGEGTGTRSDVNAWNDPMSTAAGSAMYGIDANIHKMVDLRYCEWNYCTDTGAYSLRWGLILGECPESASISDC